ncbi:MAG: glutathione binding-like protein, partial [Proteobacteria bacterium]|nr:glutathione binding-like protein [Pseudomonadota bacterium]
PMAGQLYHFVNYAPGDHPYSLERYRNEYDRCAGVLERRLEGRDWIVGDAYSIADMMCWPWILIAKPLTASLADFPNVTRWRKAVKERPAVQRAVDLLKDRDRSEPTEEEWKMLYGQNARRVSERSTKT